MEAISQLVAVVLISEMCMLSSSERPKTLDCDGPTTVSIGGLYSDSLASYNGERVEGLFYRSCLEKGGSTA